MQNGKKKGEIAGGLLVCFFGLLDGLLVCWFVGLLLRVLEKKEEEERR